MKFCVHYKCARSPRRRKGEECAACFEGREKERKREGEGEKESEKEVTTERGREKERDDDEGRRDR